MRSFAVLAACLALVAPACGGDAGGEAAETSAGAALRYLPADSGLVVLVSTDLDSAAMNDLEDMLFPLEDVLREGAADEDLSYDEDVEPLLGNDAVIGSLAEGGDAFEDAEDHLVGALEVRDAGVLRSTLEKLELRRVGEERGAEVWRAGEDEEVAAIDGDVLVVAANREALDRALAQRDGDDHLTEEALEDRLDGMPADAPIRLFGSAAGLGDVDELERFREVPWVQALESFSAALDASDDELRLDVAANTDPERIGEDDLPLATGVEAPGFVPREREISAANRDQSRTTVFLLRAMRAAYPNSRFVREVERVERELDIDFEHEVLRQFNGPSASYVSPDGRTFAARSEVSDPDALRRVLPRLAPSLPELVRALQGLESEGMALLFLFAPDAPILPAGGSLNEVEVHRPATPDGLYRVTGLTGEGPSEMWFGLRGDVFVVASNEERAEEIAEAESEQADGARGAGVMRVDVGSLREAAGQFGFFVPIERARELTASVEASTERLHLRVRLDVEADGRPFFGGD